MTTTALRFYATKNDAKVPVVIDWDNPGETVEAFPGGTLWEARRWAAHLNGQHTKPNAKCDLC